MAWPTTAPAPAPRKQNKKPQTETKSKTNKKPSTNACYGSVVFQRNHCLLLPGILKIVFIDTCYMPGTLHHNILGCFYYSHPPEEEMKLQGSQNVAEQELDLPLSAATEFLNFDDKNSLKCILYISLGKNIHKYKCE